MRLTAGSAFAVFSRGVGARGEAGPASERRLPLKEVAMAKDGQAQALRMCKDAMLERTRHVRVGELHMY